MLREYWLMTDVGSRQGVYSTMTSSELTLVGLGRRMARLGRGDQWLGMEMQLIRYRLARGIVAFVLGRRLLARE